MQKTPAVFLSVLACISCGAESYHRASPQVAPTGDQADLACTGPGVDAAQNFIVTGYKDVRDHYARVTLEVADAAHPTDTRRLGDFSFYRDITPSTPSDIHFRYVFSDPTAVTGYSVMLSDGGFTNHTTTEVKLVAPTQETVVAWLTCMDIVRLR